MVKILKYTKSEIMKKAWQMHKQSKPSETYNFETKQFEIQAPKSFAECLKQAWKYAKRQAKQNELRNDPVQRLEQINTRLKVLTMSSRMTAADRAVIKQLEEERNELMKEAS